MDDMWNCLLFVTGKIIFDQVADVIVIEKHKLQKN